MWDHHLLEHPVLSVLGVKLLKRPIRHGETKYKRPHSSLKRACVQACSVQAFKLVGLGVWLYRRLPIPLLTNFILTFYLHVRLNGGIRHHCFNILDTSPSPLPRSQKSPVNNKSQATSVSSIMVQSEPKIYLTEIPIFFYKISAWVTPWGL